MKNILYILFISLVVLVPKAEAADPADTVIIELENDSRIIIYTKNKVQLKEIEKYDINKMIRDLNKTISKDDIDYIELEDEEGNRYTNDTTIYYDDGDKTARIRLGGMELEMDTEYIDDWEDVEDEFERREDFKKYTYIDRKVDRTRNMFNVELGTSNWLENGETFPNESAEPYSVRPWGSWYVSLNSINRTWVGGPLFLDWGFGVSWYNWKLEDNTFIITKGDDEVEFIPGDPNIDPIKSKLTASYVNFNLVPMFDFAKGSRRVKTYERGSFRFKSHKKRGIRFGVGGYVGYRIASHSKFVFEDGGGREKDKERGNFYLTNFRYGLRAQFGWKGIDLFANYDLNETFANNRGPDLNAISFGIIF